MTDDLRLEEYKQKWEYLRHSEKVQFDSFKWAIIVTGAIITIIIESGQSYKITEIEGWPNVLFIFLFIYTMTSALISVETKKVQEWNRARLNELEATNEVSSPGAVGRTHVTFDLQHRMLNVISGTALFVFLGSEISGIHHGPVIALVVAFLYVIGMAFHKKRVIAKIDEGNTNA